MKDNIVLIGFMGCGKTSVGGKLSRAFQYQFLDTDQLLEEEFGCSISEFFAREGESAFRVRETELLRRLAGELTGTVLSTGGGMPLRAENAALLKQIGTVIYLKTSCRTTVERLRGDTTRPLLAGDNTEQKVEKLLAERMPLYTAAADYVIETDDRSFYEIIHEIEMLKDNKKARRSIIQ